MCNRGDRPRATNESCRRDEGQCRALLRLVFVFSASAHLYDAIYRAFKDYAGEATAIATLVRAAHPNARTILDVGCGTGEHALHLRTSHGFEVDGLELDPGLLAIAREKLPNARFFEADMAGFDVGHRYDVVLCLFSSIGYLKTLDRVTTALRCFREHLAKGGVVVVEPWFAPGVLNEGPGSTTESKTRAESKWLASSMSWACSPSRS